MSRNSKAIAIDSVDKIITDLSDRRGLRQAWDAIDDDIKQEIRNVWKDIIILELRKVPIPI